MQPGCTTAHESKYEENFGNAWQQKTFVQNRLKGNVDQYVTRSVEMCTVFVFTAVPFWNDGVGNGEIDTAICIWPPTHHLEFLKDQKWPKAFHWCKKNEVDDGVEYFKHHPQNQITNLLKDPPKNGEMVDPWRAVSNWYNHILPGWGCPFGPVAEGGNPHFGGNPKFTGHCAMQSAKLAMMGAAFGYQYRYCGRSTRTMSANAFKWNRYNQPPSGDNHAMYTHAYMIKTTTTTCPPPNFGSAFGAALGYIGWIEFVVTFLIVGTCVCLGCAKPVHPNASMMSLLKGAGLCDDLERLEKQQQAGNNSTVDQVAPIPAPPEIMVNQVAPIPAGSLDAQEVPGPKKFCKQCGNQLSVADTFCTECGSPA